MPVSICQQSGAPFPLHSRLPRILYMSGKLGEVFAAGSRHGSVNPGLPLRAQGWDQLAVAARCSPLALGASRLTVYQGKSSAKPRGYRFHLRGSRSKFWVPRSGCAFRVRVPGSRVPGFRFRARGLGVLCSDPIGSGYGRAPKGRTKQKSPRWN